ncbi:Hpt domain-containing protein [Candidatus Rhodobacter oscarellae]|nr:Hpt domain-containing protein [Candidatus Rhodobacter lobularis]
MDWDRIEELRSEVGQEDFLEVVELFLAEVDEVVERLTANANPENYEAEFHFLKGSALNLGLAEFARACSEAEKLAASGKAETICVADPILIYADSKSALLGFLETGAAA